MSWARDFRIWGLGFLGEGHWENGARLRVYGFSACYLLFGRLGACCEVVCDAALGVLCRGASLLPPVSVAKPLPLSLFLQPGPKPQTHNSEPLLEGLGFRALRVHESGSLLFLLHPTRTVSGSIASQTNPTAKCCNSTWRRQCPEIRYSRYTRPPNLTLSQCICRRTPNKNIQEAKPTGKP